MDQTPADTAWHRWAPIGQTLDWNDGSAHLHLWAFSRPLGMMQGRGAVLGYWQEVLPPQPDDMMNEHLRIVAEAPAADGGAAFPHR
ncbi:MAG: hypothetical protein QM607_11260 [Microbacterium sp.]